ncbi:MAG: hypothetical protein GY943_16675 [Chloroflexi bacterium]|nr:hypothetical protein [Chloroflexota bacterium]
MTFDEHERTVLKFFQEGAYQQSFDLLAAHVDDFPEQVSFNFYMRTCAAVRLEKNALALDLLTEALDAGIWYSEPIFRQSPSLQPLQGIARFEELVKVSAAKAAESQGDGEVKTAVPDTQPPYPLLLALHGNGSSVAAEFRQWETAVSHGKLLVAPQSSQSLWAGSHSWTDEESAAKEITAHLAEVEKMHDIDWQNTLVGGFSMGANVALWLALSGTVAAQRFMLVGPGGPHFDDPSKWQPLIEQAKGRDLQGMILFSHDDPHIEPKKIEETAVLLNNAGFNCELVPYTGLLHEYPPDFADRLLNVLNS